MKINRRLSGFFGSLLTQLCVSLVASLISATSARAGYPVVDGVAGLPYPELITVYPDDSDKSLYYFVPTTLSFVYEKQADGTLHPRLGVQYWGLTGPDPDGIGAALTFSVQPAIDREKVGKVADALKKANPNARFAYPSLVSSRMDLIINDHYVGSSQDKTEPVSKSAGTLSSTAGTVDATQAFSIGLSRLGARAFSQGVAPDSDVFAARYTYKFTGIAKRLHAKITVFDKRVYDHFKASASASAWWGLVKSSWAADWQKLTTDGSIKLEYLEGGDTDGDNYMLEVFKLIVNRVVNQEGFFHPELKPGGVPTAESVQWGWGFNSSAGWEHLEETHNFSVEINKAKLEDREFTVGLSFSAVCAKYPTSFVDLTKLGEGKPATAAQGCLDKNAFSAVLKDVKACTTAKLTYYKSLLDQGLINQATYDAKSAKVLDEICYKDDIPANAGIVAAPNLAPIKEALDKGQITASDAEGIMQPWLDRPKAAVQPSAINNVRAQTHGISR